MLERLTLDNVADRVRERLVIEGARPSYLQNCASMQRIHISPALGKKRIERVTPGDVERLARSMLERGLAPKTVRNTMTFLSSMFSLAVTEGWIPSNPVTRATRPRRRRQGDASPDLQFRARSVPSSTSARCGAQSTTISIPTSPSANLTSVQYSPPSTRAVRTVIDHDTDGCQPT